MSATSQKLLTEIAAELGRLDAEDGREPLWYRVEESYISTESGHIGNPELGEAYVTAYCKERATLRLTESTPHE